MEITVELPDDVTQHQNPGREALERLVIAGYSSGALTSHEACVLLGFETRFELDGFLKDKKVEEGSYGIKEYQQDLKASEHLRANARKKRSA